MPYFLRLTLLQIGVIAVATSTARPADRSAQPASADYFPPPESAGGWRELRSSQAIREVAGMDPARLDDLKAWLLESDRRDFAAVVIRRGHVVLQVERGNSARSDSRRVASVSKAVCATVLAIASEQSQQGRTPRRMKFDDLAFDFIPWARPLSDPRKARITVKQLLNHTSGVCPEAIGAPNEGTWEYVLGLNGDRRTARLAFDPGTACGYSTHALDHAALVCESVTGKPYDRFAIEALFRPLGIEHWWFEFFDGGPGVGRHPSHGLGMPARDLARIAYCMLRGGRWGDRQIVPKWFVDETAAPTHAVHGPEMRFRINAQTFSHGWELPARLTGEGGRTGKGIPADARHKPGSGGQLMAFVPSLDLVVTRQTGDSGDWQYEEYLRRACQAVVKSEAGDGSFKAKTRVEIADGKWHLNGKPTYSGAKSEGLLMNVRMVNAVFEDVKRKDVHHEANTEKFIAAVPDYVAHGVRAFTIGLQGGFPGYEGAVNSAFAPDGSLRRSYLDRVAKVIEACDRQGAVVILGCYYQRQDQVLRDEAAVRAGVIHVAQWIRQRGYANVLLEIANEYPHEGFDHRVLRSAEGEADLIAQARRVSPRLLVSTSGIGEGQLAEPVARASDFLLVHFNGVPVREIAERIRALKPYGKPIVCNEDDKSSKASAEAAEASVAAGASWGLMLEKTNQRYPFTFRGAADDPLVYATLRRLTTP